VPGSEEGFAEVAGDDLIFIADGGEVDAGVPADEYIDVRRYIMELKRRQQDRFLTAASHRLGMTRVCGSGWAEEWFQQFGDAGGVHGISILDWRLVLAEVAGRR
jgi:hypothetical protein